MSDVRLRELERQAQAGDLEARAQLRQERRRLGSRFGTCFTIGHLLGKWTVRWTDNGVYCCRPCQRCDSDCCSHPATVWDIENAPTTQGERWEPWAVIHDRTYLPRTTV